ncbi:MAG: hypothetical protein M1135_03080 [Candidatus Omnitrophica bacterium]|nr:hypothetical protein [Candidatus Omnitrophota bacterium]
MRKIMSCILLSLIVFISVSVYAADSLKVTVYPEKIVYKPGETANIKVNITNSAAAAKTAKVSLMILWGINETSSLTPQTLSIPGKGMATAQFFWPVPKNHEWGHEALAVVTDKNGAQTTGYEYFTVGNDPWILGHYITLFDLQGAKKSGAIDNSILPEFRNHYITTIESYNTLPSSFGGMVPKTDIYYAAEDGGWTREGRRDWQYLVKQAHKMGMAVVVCVQDWAAGPVGFDFVRKHPDWVTYGKDGRPANAWFDLATLELHRKNPQAGPPNCGGAIPMNFLNTNQQVGDYWIKNLINSVKMFGWDGFRSDGIPVVVNGYDYKGILHETNTDKATAKFWEKIRRKLLEHFPHFLFGWNSEIGGFPPPPTYGPKTVDAQFPESYELFENFNSAAQPSSPFHPWKKAVYYMENEVAAVRDKHHGYPHVGWMPSNRYLEAIASACGEHVDTWTYLDYRRFEFRYSEFLWDNALHFVRPADSIVTVDGPARVWWKKFVQSEDLPGKGRYVIVNLVNMPKTNDDAWADRPPSPAANVKVYFKPIDGKTPKKIGVFSPDTPGYVVTVNTSGNGAIVIPEVKIWTMVVADY